MVPAAGDDGGVWMESRFVERREPVSAATHHNHHHDNHVDVSGADTGNPADVSTRVDRVVYVLFVVFGLGSWITINGLFAELPLFYKDLPE